jgi:hypothetical protein
MSNTEIPEGFTPWHGGECPCPGRRVQIVMAGCSFKPKTISHNAENLRWSHVPTNPVGDILAYRII